MTQVKGKSQDDCRDAFTAGLAQFCNGTDRYYRYGWMKLIYTDGVKYVIDRADAHWLITDIWAWQHESKVKDAPYQSWKLKVAGDPACGIRGPAVLTCDDGDGNIIASQKYSGTDFPAREIEIWCQNGEDGYKVFLLPSEY